MSIPIQDTSHPSSAWWRVICKFRATTTRRELLHASILLR
jgi:hypothetical protein